MLSFFMGSLKNPTLEQPPSVVDMLSWNTLTPHYEEDVIYALSAQSTAKSFDMQGPNVYKVRGPGERGCGGSRELLHWMSPSHQISA